MLLTVMMISGAVLSATSVVGLLTIYEIRHTTSAIASAKAVFAADAGVECALMTHKDGVDRGCGNGQTTILTDGKIQTTFTIYDITDASGNIVGKRVVGKFGQTARSIETTF